MRDDDYEERPQRRESIMQQRLRRSRGEEEELDAYEPYDDRAAGFGGYRAAPRYGPPGGGCATATLYVVLGAIVALIVVLFFVNRAFGSIGQMFEEAVPDVAQIVATPTPEIISGAAVVQRIQGLSRLETAEYTIERVIDVRQGSNIPVIGDFLQGDELLLIAHGNVVAGVDLGQLTPDAVTVSPDGQTITVRLPPAQIIRASLDSQKTRVYSRERGLLAPENKDLETLARQTAEQQILQAACEDGIMQKATQEAETALRQFLGLLDVAQVVVVAAPPAACVAPAIPAAPAPGATPAP